MPVCWEISLKKLVVSHDFLELPDPDKTISLLTFESHVPSPFITDGFRFTKPMRRKLESIYTLGRIDSQRKQTLDKLLSIGVCETSGSLSVC